MRRNKIKGRSELFYYNGEPYTIEDVISEGVYYVYLDGKPLETCKDYSELREVYAQYGISI